MTSTQYSSKQPRALSRQRSQHDEPGEVCRTMSDMSRSNSNSIRSRDSTRPDHRRRSYSPPGKAAVAFTVRNTRGDSSNQHDERRLSRERRPGEQGQRGFNRHNDDRKDASRSSEREQFADPKQRRDNFSESGRIGKRDVDDERRRPPEHQVHRTKYSSPIRTTKSSPHNSPGERRDSSGSRNSAPIRDSHHRRLSPSGSDRRDGQHRSPSKVRPAFRRNSSLSSLHEAASLDRQRGDDRRTWSQGKASNKKDNLSRPVQSPDISRRHSTNSHNGRVSPETLVNRETAKTVASSSSSPPHRIPKDEASLIAQQHRSSLGSRWGPRDVASAAAAAAADAAAVALSVSQEGELPSVLTPDLIATSPEESVKEPSFDMGTVGPKNDVVSAEDDKTSQVLSKDHLGMSLKDSVIGKDLSLPIARKKKETKQLPPPISATCFGFTAKERRLVETTDLTEVSTTTSSLDGTNAIRSTSSLSSSTLSSWLPDAELQIPRHAQLLPPPVVTVQPIVEPAVLPSNVSCRSFADVSVETVSRTGTALGDRCINSKRQKSESRQGTLDKELERIPKKKSSVPVRHDAVVAKLKEPKALTNERALSVDSNDHPISPNSARSKEAKGGKSRDCTDPSLIVVGSRVAVYWDGEGRYYKGKVIRERPGKKKPYFVRYDDGDQEWMSFENERFRLLSTPTKNSETGSLDHKLPGNTGEVTLPEKDQTAQLFPKKKKKKRKHLLGSTGEEVNVSDKDQTAQPSPKKKKREQLSEDGENKRKDSKSDGTLSQQTIIDKGESEVASIANHSECDQPKEKQMIEAGHVQSELSSSKVATCDVAVDVPDWVVDGVSRSANDSDDSETDEEELINWAATMLGAPRPIARRKTSSAASQAAGDKATLAELDPSWEAVLAVADVPMSISEKVKLARRKNNGSVSLVESSKSLKKQSKCPKKRMLSDADREQEAKRRKEQARPLTAAEINSILADDLGLESSSWVRRSVRQPSKSSLSAPRVKALLEKLLLNDSDMVVLKMKKYCSDLDTPCLVIDAVLDALEENTNCEALYIQNFNEGMRDDQVLHLLKVLQQPSCKIWCLNIGETYKVKMKTWEKFTNGLQSTKITHMYASEHTITAELKDQIRETIRCNRVKHNMHCDPNNLDTIVQCTHCWWNPINTKSLRPYLQKKGYDHILADAEVQGLQGSMSGATLS